MSQSCGAIRKKTRAILTDITHIVKCVNYLTHTAMIVDIIPVVLLNCLGRYIPIQLYDILSIILVMMKRAFGGFFHPITNGLPMLCRVTIILTSFSLPHV